MKLFGLEIKRAANVTNYIVKPGTERIGTFEISEYPVQIVPATVQNYKNALNGARGQYIQQRGVLYDMYQNALDFDAHLRGLIEKRLLATTGRKLEYIVNDEPHEATNVLTDSPKWDEFLKQILLHKLFWGMGLIEVGQKEWNGQQLFDFGVIPIKHIDPYEQMVRVIPFGASAGDKSYADVPTALFIGEREDFGLLLQLTLLSIYRRDLQNNWATYSQKAGNNFEVIKKKGAQLDPNERQQLLDRFRSRQAGDVMDMPSDYTHEITNTSSSSQNQLFEGRNEALKDEMTVLVLGQTETTEGGGGSLAKAEVHERQQETLFDADAKNLLDTLNYDFYESAVRLFGLPDGGRWQFAENTSGKFLRQIEIDKALHSIGYVFTQEDLQKRYNL
jgi:hypothetical protein